MSVVFDLSYPLRDFVLDMSATFSGKATGISGPSGSGKSTLFQLIAGLKKPVRGSVMVNGKVLYDSRKGICVPVHKRAVGMVFQEKLLFPHLSVRKNLNFSQAYTSRSRISFFDVVEILDLAHILDAKPGVISGGEQQRVAIGRALLASPDILLLDEPFSAVDKDLRGSIIGYLFRLKEGLDVPLAIISHDPSDFTALADEVVFIDKGRRVNKKCPYHDRLTEVLRQ
ncbi:MAG: ATP-binding cassette domain-containing protein [Spirochaetales bacterium]|nr:ATP-binding cassette domain-containing protein [Spirochaetales bacterium]